MRRPPTTSPTPPAPRPEQLEADTINGRVLLTDAEAAQAMSVCRRTFRRMVASGDMPKPVRLSTRCVRWSARDLLGRLDSLRGS